MKFSLIICLCVLLTTSFGKDTIPQDELAKLKLANSKVWLQVKKNPDARFYDWRGVDLRILSEQTDLLHSEIMKEDPDLMFLDRSAWEVWRQQKTINKRNYKKKIEKPRSSNININYFSTGL